MLSHTNHYIAINTVISQISAFRAYFYKIHFGIFMVRKKRPFIYNPGVIAWKKPFV